MMARRLLLRITAIILSVVACVSDASPPVLEGPRLDLAVWYPVYQRPGWDGNATLDLRAVGDVMLGRFIAAHARARGVAYPFNIVGRDGAAPLLDGDLVVGNLESPLTDRADTLRPGPYRLPAPTLFAPALSAAGFDALSLANNHGLDAGPAGLADAVAALEHVDIAVIGAGRDATASRAPVRLDLHGQHVALLAFNDVPDPLDESDEGSGWGRAWLDQEAEAAVREAARIHDLVIVLVHWGEEYRAAPSPRQRAWAMRLTIAGADLIIGAHPHVLQPIERITAGRRQALVAYSLGNFIFDQEGRFETSTGVVLRVLTDMNGVAVVAVAPVDSHNGQVYPLPSQSAEGRAALRAVDAPGDLNAGDPAPHPRLHAWRWTGNTAVPTLVPRRANRIVQPDQLLVDLRGDDLPLWVRRTTAGIVTIASLEAPDQILWQNEASDWYVRQIVAGDPNNDGRTELLLLTWKPDADGIFQVHPFLIGYRGDRFRVIWGGSPIQPAAQDAAIGDLDGDGTNELVVLRGGSRPSDAATTLMVLHWEGWIFTAAWETSIAAAHAVSLQDLDGDGRLEIIVE